MSDRHSTSIHEVDKPTAVAAASFLITLGQMISNTQPVFLGAVGAQYHFDDGRLGVMGSTFVAALTVAAMTAPLWVRRVSWRIFSTIVVLAFVGGYLAGSVVASVVGLVGLFAFLGVASALTGAPAFASLGDTANPDRNYSIATIFQAVMSAALVAPLMGYVVPKWGAKGLFLCMAVVTAAGLVACRWLPRAGRFGAAATLDDGAPLDAEAPSAERPLLPPSMVLAAIGLFSAGLTGFWFFIERIGEAHGVSPQLIGLTLSLCSLLTIGASALVVWLSKRFSSLTFIAIGTAGQVAGFLLVALASPLGFVLGNMLFSLSFGLSQPCYWALLRRLDGTGKLFVAAPAAMGVAGALIGLIAGRLIARGGYGGLMVDCAALVTAGLALAIAASLLGRGRRVVSNAIA